MKEENVILVKTYSFALRILKLHAHLRKKKIDNALCSQLSGSGTSIGANMKEAVGGVAGKDFITKLQVAYKEARETRYGLRLLLDGGLLDKKLASSCIEDGEEIIRKLTAIVNTSKSGGNS